jgi:hypothetical protein
MTITRLTAFDLMFLRLESPDWPCHYGGLAIVAGEGLLDAAGQLRLDEMRTRLDRRVAWVPQMCRRVHHPGPLRGGPLWVDDDRFDISRHVRELVVDPPGDELALLEATDRVYRRLLDRRRPLWELWFLTGLGDGRVGVLLKLHHAVADGLAAVAITGALFDREPDVPDPEPTRPVAAPILKRRTRVGSSIHAPRDGFAGQRNNRLRRVADTGVAHRSGAPREALRSPGCGEHVPHRSCMAGGHGLSGSEQQRPLRGEERLEPAVSG